MTLAMGTPLARLFFEPQKVMVIWSASLKPIRRLPKVVAQRTSASRTMSATMTTAMSESEKVCHRPSTTAVEKAR